MKNISEFLDFFGAQLTLLNRLHADLDDYPLADGLTYEETCVIYGEIIIWLTGMNSKELERAPEVTEDADLFSLNPLDMESLPDDLSLEINLSQSDKDDAQILELLRIADRPLDLNELLIGCYRKYQVKHKRNLLTSRIYRLMKRDLVHSVGKGKYGLGGGSEFAEVFDTDEDEL